MVQLAANADDEIPDEPINTTTHTCARKLGRSTRLTAQLPNWRG